MIESGRIEAEHVGDSVLKEEARVQFLLYNFSITYSNVSRGLTLDFGRTETERNDLNSGNGPEGVRMKRPEVSVGRSISIPWVSTIDQLVWPLGWFGFGSGF